MSQTGGANGQEHLTQVLWKRGVRLFDQGKYDQALPYLLQYIKRQPEDSEALNKAGATYANLEQLEKAEYFFKRALQLNPKLSAAHSNMGNIHFAKGEYDRAVARYKHALSVDPSYHQAKRNMAAALRKQGKFGDAVKALRSADRELATERTQAKRVAEPDHNARNNRPGSNRGCLLVILFVIVAFVLYRVVTGW